MKVMHVAECAGGVDRYLQLLLKYSTLENVVVLSQLYKKDEYKDLANHVEIMHMSHSIGIKVIGEALNLRKKIKKYNPDIVYAHSSIAGAITRMACIGLEVKVIYNPHGWSFNMESTKSFFFVVAERIMSHFCDAIVCISEAERESAIKKKICKKKKLHVIENGIDIDKYKIEKIELPVPDNALVVGMVGRICRQKAPDVFVKMAVEIQKKIKDVYFVIVGDVLEGAENEKKEIENFAIKQGVKLLITGWVDNPLSYMSRFNVGCLLSRWEGFGLVIPEYMLTGTPLVATRVDAIPYLINDGENGLLVEKDDWMEAANKVVQLIQDEKLRIKLIENGQRTVKKRFNARRVSKEIENLYGELVR